MLNTLEHPKDVEESMLSQVLETSAPLKYFLRADQLMSLIGRASARETSLPKKMGDVFQKQIVTLSNMQESVESPQLVRKQKDTEMTGKATRLTAGAPQTLYVRRLMPSECEALQGFPKNWTETGTEL
jgi:site-specific DNA-cytosine methylase